MEKLDSKSLMIGDLVICHHPTQPPKIVTVTSGLLSILERQENGIIDEKSPLYRIVKPISITKEILKKNGFSKIGMIGDSYIHCIATDTCYYEIEINLHDNTFCINNTWFKANDIHYVHELQHLLKLCGIKKEIKL